jgi:hypothetical protein
MANTQISILIDTTDTFAAFPDAFNDHDANALMNVMIKDASPVAAQHAACRNGYLRVDLPMAGTSKQKVACDLFEFRHELAALQRAFLSERPKQDF